MFSFLRCACLKVMRAADNYWKSEYFKKCAGTSAEAVFISDKDPRSNAQKVDVL